MFDESTFCLVALTHAVRMIFDEPMNDIHSIIILINQCVDMFNGESHIELCVCVCVLASIGEFNIIMNSLAVNSSLPNVLMVSHRIVSWLNLFSFSKNLTFHLDMCHETKCMLELSINAVLFPLLLIHIFFFFCFFFGFCFGVNRKYPSVKSA